MVLCYNSPRKLRQQPSWILSHTSDHLYHKELPYFRPYWMLSHTAENFKISQEGVNFSSFSSFYGWLLFLNTTVTFSLHWESPPISLGPPLFPTYKLKRDKLSFAYGKPKQTFKWKSVFKLGCDIWNYPGILHFREKVLKKKKVFILQNLAN